MKKTLAAAMAAVLSMSMVFSSLAAEKLEAPTVFWGEEREALPQWSRVENAAGQYQVEAYKDDTRIYNSHYTFPANDKSEILSAGGFVSTLEESGIYKFRICPSVMGITQKTATGPLSPITGLLQKPM